jgi:hypothetical protein
LKARAAGAVSERHYARALQLRRTGEEQDVDNLIAMTGAQLTITIFVIAFYAAVIWMVVDVIRRKDLGAGAKVFWIFAGLVFSLAAVLLYLLVGKRRHQEHPESSTAPE